MSAFADESAGTAPSLINSCILRMHSAQVPIVGGRSFLFVECFGSELQPAALDLVNTLNSTRQVLLQQSSQDSYDYLHFISQLDMYRERLAVLLESLSCQSVVNLHTALQVCTSCPLSSLV